MIVQQLAGIVYPWRSEAKAQMPLLRWCLHLVLWTGLLAGLWYLNRWGGLERVLRSPWPMLHRTWLPLLALSIYGLGWLARGLWLALACDPLPTSWPDVDAAWNEVRVALDKTNIDVGRAPLFLILGPLTHNQISIAADLQFSIGVTGPEELGAVCSESRQLKRANYIGVVCKIHPRFRARDSSQRLLRRGVA